MAKNTYEVYARMRDARGVTDYRVAKDIGFRTAMFSNWKAGRFAPKLEKLKRIADYFGVSVEVFI